VENAELKNNLKIQAEDENISESISIQKKMPVYFSLK
jgi:hypothetical protein